MLGALAIIGVTLGSVSLLFYALVKTTAWVDKTATQGSKTSKRSEKTDTL